MATEVKTKLTLDDAASKILDEIRDGFEELNESVDDVKQGTGDLVKEFVAMTAAVNFTEMVKGAYNYGTAIVTMASGVHDAEQALAGFKAGMEGMPWMVARREAEALHDEIEDLAITIGQSRDDILAGHNAIITFLGGSSEAYATAKKNIEDLTVVANVTGLSVQELGAQFGKMGAGFLSTESAVFNLLRGTGIFAENIKDVTKEWQELTQAERLERLEYATGKLADNLATAKPTMTDLLTSMQEMGKQFLETMGEPVLDELIPVFEDLRDRFMESKAELRAFARTMGREVAKWVVEAADKIKEGFEYLRTHGEEFKQHILDAMSTVKRVVDFIIANKEAIAIAFGARMAAPVVAPAAQAAKGLYQMGAGGTQIGGAALAGAAGGAATIAAFAAAVASFGLAVDQYVRLQSELSNERGDAGARMDFMKRFEATQKAGGVEAHRRLSAEEVAHFQHVSNELVKQADAFGMTQRQMRSYTDGLMAMHQKNRELVQDFQNMVDATAKAEAITQQYTETMKKQVSEGKYTQAAADEMIKQFAAENEETYLNAAMSLGTAWNVAMNADQTGRAQFIAKLLGGATHLQDAFIASADMSAAGFSELASQMEQYSKEFAERLRNAAKAEEKIEAAAKEGPKAPKIHMSGGQTFKIQQDFRDQDPDRVAIVFQRDIARSAERRYQARTTTPFGY